MTSSLVNISQYDTVRKIHKFVIGQEFSNQKTALAAAYGDSSRWASQNSVFHLTDGEDDLNLVEPPILWFAVLNYQNDTRTLFNFFADDKSKFEDYSYEPTGWPTSDSDSLYLLENWDHITGQRGKFEHRLLFYRIAQRPQAGDYKYKFFGHYAPDSLIHFKDKITPCTIWKRLETEVTIPRRKSGKDDLIWTKR